MIIIKFLKDHNQHIIACNKRQQKGIRIETQNVHETSSVTVKGHRSIPHYLFTYPTVNSFRSLSPPYNWLHPVFGVLACTPGKHGNPDLIKCSNPHASEPTHSDPNLFMPTAFRSPQYSAVTNKYELSRFT
jgi:hypothetical protein